MSEHEKNEIVCVDPGREMTWFQKLIRRDQSLFTVNITQAKQILENILWRMRNE